MDRSGKFIENKKRFKNSLGNQKQYDSHKKAKHDERIKHSIIDEVQSQKGIRGELVLFQSNLDMPFTVLQNAADRIGGLIKLLTINKENAGNTYQLLINDEILAEGVYENINVAKKNLAELAISNLRTTCFTIFRKVHPRDSPKVDLPSVSCSDPLSASCSDPPSASCSDPTDPPATNNIKGIGAKMMLQMGWSGGGLGAQEQGRTNIIQPYIQIQRQGLGTKNIVQEVKRVLQDYATSRDINSIAFSSDFTKEERVVIHEVARKLNLKSRSYGKEGDRVLVVQSKTIPWDLVHSLLDVGGENDQLKLILPTNFDNSVNELIKINHNSNLE